MLYLLNSFDFGKSFESPSILGIAADRVGKLLLQALSSLPFLRINFDDIAPVRGLAS
jgi:hypothetical protein